MKIQPAMRRKKKKKINGGVRGVVQSGVVVRLGAGFFSLPASSTSF